MHFANANLSKTCKTLQLNYKLKFGVGQSGGSKNFFVFLGFLNNTSTMICFEFFVRICRHTSDRT